MGAYTTLHRYPEMPWFLDLARFLPPMETRQTNTARQTALPWHIGTYENAAGSVTLPGGHFINSAPQSL